MGDDETKEKRAETHVGTAALGCPASQARQTFSAAASQETQHAGRAQIWHKKRKRPDSLRVIGRSSNSPPPKSAQEPLYVLIAAGGMARTGDSCGQSGRPGRNRTCNRRIRNPMLYPFELRAQVVTLQLFTLQRIVSNDLLTAICRLANPSLFGNIRPRTPLQTSAFTRHPGEMFDTVQCLRYCSNWDSA